MSVSLQKGQKVSLSKDHAGLSKVVVGLGWDEARREKAGFFAPKPKPIDCDASALLLINGSIRNLIKRRTALWKRRYCIFWKSQA